MVETSASHHFATLMIGTSYPSSHQLGVEETPSGNLAYTLIVNGSEFLVRRKAHDSQWRNLESVVIPPDAFSQYTVKGKNLRDLVAQARSTLSSGGKVVPV